MSDHGKKDSGGALPKAGQVFGVLVALGIGLYILSFGLSQIIELITYNTRGFLILVIVIGLVNMSIASKDDGHH